MPEVKTDEKEKTAREEAKERKEAAAAQARKEKIDAGDLIVTKTHEFEATEKAPASTKVLAKILADYRKAPGKPLIFNDIATKHGAKYPEDVIVAMYSLEQEGFVKRFNARSKEGNERRPRVAFMWVAE